MKRVLQLKFRRLAAAGGKVSFVFRNGRGRFCGAWNTKYKLATEKGCLGYSICAISSKFRSASSFDCENESKNERVNFFSLLSPPFFLKLTFLFNLAVRCLHCVAKAQNMRSCCKIELNYKE